MRGSPSIEDEPAYRQLLHGPSSPTEFYACLRDFFQGGFAT